MMLWQIQIRFAVLAALVWYPLVATGQVEPPPSGYSAKADATNRWTSLPTDRSLRMEAGLPWDSGVPERLPLISDPQSRNALAPASGPPMDLKSLLRPRFDASAEWEPEVGGVAIGSYDMSVRMPTYPIFGPPPPILNAGYSFTNIDAPAALDLPQSLHEFSFGAA
jgi:hypothetical protein